MHDNTKRNLEKCDKKRAGRRRRGQIREPDEQQQRSYPTYVQAVRAHEVCSGLNPVGDRELFQYATRHLSVRFASVVGRAYRAFIISQLSTSERKRYARGILSWLRRWSTRIWTGMRPKIPSCLGCTRSSKPSGKNPPITFLKTKFEL